MENSFYKKFHASGLGESEPKTLEQLNIKVELAGENDWEDLQKIRLEAVDTNPAEFSLTKKDVLKEHKKDESEWKKVLREEIVVLSRCNSKPAGMVKGVDRKGGIFSINNTYTSPNFRKMGIAKGMIKMVLEEIKKRGGTYARLWVKTSNENGIKLYENLGFKKLTLSLKRLLELTGNRPDLLIGWQIMELDLTQPELDFNDLVASTISKLHIGSNKFYELKDNPNKIIRAVSFDELLYEYDNKITIPELVETAKKLYKELEEKYEIVAPVDFTTSKDKDGKNVVCSITDKIEGQSLEKVEKSEEFINKVEKLYSSVVKYFLDKFKSGGLYVWDINGESQYIYGKKIGDKEEQIYLIDTDIRLSKNKNDMYLSVYWLARHMTSLEHRLGVQFQEARNSINEFINQPLPKDTDESVHKNIDGIKKILAGEKSDYYPESAIPRFE